MLELFSFVGNQFKRIILICLGNMLKTEPTMQQSEFIRRYCAAPHLFAWFLGAGASRGAGLPTATDITDDLKRQYYASEENVRLQTREMQYPAVREKVDAFFQARGFPEPWSDDEYSSLFSLIFGEDRERQRQYISRMLAEERASLALGNRVLGALIAAELCRCVFTTNFDTVVEKALAEVGGRSLAAFHLEGAHSAVTALNNEDFPLYVKLHGDFRYDSIKNLAADLEDQHRDLSRCLVAAANRFGMVFAGYSGRDKSVMDLLHETLETPNPFPQGVYWFAMKGSTPPPSVTAFVSAASNKSVEAHIVEIDNFDAVLLRIWRYLDPRPEDLDAKVRKGAALPVKIARSVTKTGKPILRFNAFPIVEVPRSAWKLQAQASLDWTGLRELVKDAQGQLIATKEGETIGVFGQKSDVKDAFKVADTDIEEVSFTTDWQATGRFHVKRFLEDALAAALTRDRPLMTRRRGSQTWVVVDHSDTDIGALEPLFKAVGKTSGLIPGISVPASEKGDGAPRVHFAEGAHINLSFADDRLWGLITPDVWVTPMFARRHAEDFLTRRKRDRFNDKHDKLISAWMSVFSDGATAAETIGVSAFGEGSDAGDAAFSFVNRTGFAWRAMS